MHYAFQHMSTITKLSSDVTQYYKNITSPIGANARIQRDVQVWTVQGHSRVYREKTRETRRGVEKDRASDGLLEIYATPILLKSELGESTCSKLRDLNIQIQGSQNSPMISKMSAKWRAGRSTCVSINPSPRTCIENRLISIGIQEKGMRQQGK